MLYITFSIFVKLELTSEINTSKLSSIKGDSVLERYKEVTYFFKLSLKIIFLCIYLLFSRYITFKLKHYI